MQYTVAPLSYLGIASFGTIVSILLLLFFLWGVFYWNWKDEIDNIPAGIFLFFVGSIFIPIAYASYDSYREHGKLINEQVVGKMIGNESALESVSSGRGQTRLASVLYVFYQLPDGVVSFRRASGIIYPEEAIFYRNPK